MRKRIYLYGDTSFGGAKYFAQQVAVNCHVTGLSKKDKEKITIEAQGQPQAVEKYIKKVSKGNQFFKVEHFDVEDIEDVNGEHIFSVK